LIVRASGKSGGNPAGLSRSLGVFGVLFLTLSVTTPASSVFVIVPGMLSVAGTGALLAVLIAGLICVATAYVYAELSSAWPVAGGEYVMVVHTLGPMAGFVMLGVNVFNNLLFPPVAALGVSALLSAVLPGLPEIPTAIGVMTLATAVAVLNIRVNAWITGLFLLIEVAALLIVSWLGFDHAHLPLGEILWHPLMPAPGGLVPASASSIGVATTIAIFALNGYGVAVYFGEEMHQAPRLIARAILAALLLGLVLEALPLLAALTGAPDLQALLVSDDPFGQLVRLRGGEPIANWVSIAVVVAILNAVIAAILATARFFFGTARDKSWGHPFDHWMSHVHPGLGSPWLGTLIVGGIGIACCFLPLTFLLVVSGAGLVAIYAGIALAAIAGRRSGATRHAEFKMPLYPLWPVLTLIALLYVTWTSWLDPEEGRPALIATAAQVGASMLYYRLVLKPRGWTAEVPAER